jgi:RNA polymerase primary sigma factor
MKTMRELKIHERLTLRTRNIERYFNDVSKSSMLSGDEETELAKRIRDGDTRAMHDLVQANLRFVVSVAKQYSTNPDILPELISQGNIGLITAAKTFDHTRGFKFISHAVWHIRAEIMNYFNQQQKPVRLPAHVILDLGRARKVDSFLQQRLGRSPSIDEIVAEMARHDWNITPEHLTHILGLEHGQVALETDNPEEDWAPIQWLHSDLDSSSNLRGHDRTAIFSLVTAGLTPAEKEIVILKFGLGSLGEASFFEIGKKFNRTSEWARLNFKKALKKMKKAAKDLRLDQEL